MLIKNGIINVSLIINTEAVQKEGVSMTKSVGSDREQKPKRPPATTPEGREQQLIALAMEATEKRIKNGTATAQELCHFLKAGSPTAKLERQILEKQKELITAKTEAIESQKRVEELYSNALSAMRAYSGSSEREDEYED